MAGEGAESQASVLSALRAGQPVLGGIVEWMQEGVVVHDTSGRIVEATTAACRLLGVTEAQLLGRDTTRRDWRVVDATGAVVPPERQPAVITLRTGQPADAVMGVHRPDGTLVWLRVSAVPLPVEGGERPMVVATFVDVTERVENRMRVAESEQRFRLTLQYAPIGMAIVGLDGAFVEVNTRLADMFGMEPADLLGRTFQELTHPDDLDADLALLDRLIEGRIDSYDLEKRYIATDGSVVWTHLAVALVRDVGGGPLHFVSQVQDITEARRAQEMLEQRALFDPLTGLANRALAADRLQQMLARASSEGSVTVMCCDIDDLKRVNDSLGYGAGDVLVAALAERIVAAVGSPERVGRGPGDEFFVLIEGLEPSDGPPAVVESIVDAVGRPLEILGHEIRPTVCIGVAVDRVEADADAMLHDATSALHVAKGRGRGRWELFDHTIRVRAVQRLTVESQLGAALARGEVQPHYQPIVDMETREVVGYEALARWHHPDHGLLLPGLFVPIAEDAGLIGQLGAVVLDAACGFVARHPDDRFQMFVNVSPAQLGVGHFTELVSDTLERHGVSPRRLGLELTETSVLHATGASFRDLHELAELGVDLVLDDFGTGYSAMASLLSIPIQGLKLDRSFTSRLGIEGQADQVTRALGGMVEALGFHGVVEGVETEAQRRAALAAGWRLGQGWLFGRPQPEADLHQGN